MVQPQISIPLPKPECVTIVMPMRAVDGTDGWISKEIPREVFLRLPNSIFLVWFRHEIAKRVKEQEANNAD